MTCKDCKNYEDCKLKNEYIALDTRVEELVANDFKCFVPKNKNIGGKDGEN